MLRDVPIKVLLLLSFLVAGLIPLMVFAILSQSAARSALVNQAERQLESVRDLKAAELVRFFDGAARQVEVLAADPTTAQALRDLTRVATASGGPDALGLEGRTRGVFAANGAYRREHDRHLPFFGRFAAGHGFYDLFLMDPKTGFTLFTVVKEADFGVHVRRTDSALKDVFVAAADARRTAVSDTRPYGPSGDAPAQFVAAPVVVDGQLLGVVAVQISIDAIDRIMRERSGMGRSGDAYLVGPDLRLRSDTALDPGAHSVVASFRGPVAAHGVDTATVRAALGGAVTVQPITGYHGRHVLSASAPVDFHGVRWALVAEVDEAEIDATIAAALNTETTVTIALSVVLLVVLTFGVSLVSSRGIGRVVAALGSLIDRVLAGREHVRLDPDELAVDFRGVAVKTNELAAALVQQTAANHQLEDVLHYNQRMESIGTLAGGIAHDFNNVLTYLVTYVDLVADELPPESRARAHMDEIALGIDRASALVAQIMLFSRQMKRERKPVNVALIVKEAVKLLKATLPSTIMVAKQVDGGDLYVLADPTQVHQVVMNLCTNAFHAMLRTGGVLTVTLSRRDVVAGEPMHGSGSRPEPAAALGGSRSGSAGAAEGVEPRPIRSGLAAPLAPGAYCALTVGDTGEGIDPAIADRVFEPFFTTKPVGQGTGMGLAVVHGIVTAHAGHIAIDSAPGRGTVVTVLLPLHAPAVGSADGARTPDAIRGHGRVLLVDDEPAICDAVGAALNALGYEVEACTAPLEALARFTADPQRFDVVLTDLSMPTLDGAELARRLLALRPGLPIILSTGYSERMTAEGAAELGAAGLLLKPYPRHALSLALHDALSATRAPA